MVVDFLLLAFGLTLLGGGGESLVRGASGLARSLGVPPLAIGLTVVALGTSAPELAVNVTAAWQDQTGISFGNIFGSNMANIGLIVGCAALLRPLPITSVVITREIPMMLFVTALAVFMSLDVLLGREVNQFDRADGMILLLFIGVFLWYTLRDLMRQRGSNAEIDARIDGAGGPGAAAIFLNVLLAIAGMAALMAGAKVTVDAAMSVARSFGIPEVIIGLTVVAVGTSLPELATAVVATLRGQIDLAIGNVVGSNILNILLVGGATAVIRPIPVPALGYYDLAVTGFLSAVLLFFSTTSNRQILRAEGVLLLAVYLGYLTWRTLVTPQLVASIS
jgi:cation:H+ antiporter